MAKRRGPIGTFFYWLGQFLFIDQKGNYLSHTKFWSNIGYAIWTALFPYAVLVGSKASYDLWLVFGAVVIGNRTLARALESRKGAGSYGPDERYSDDGSSHYSKPNRYGRPGRYNRYDDEEDTYYRRPSRYNRYDEEDGDSYTRDRASAREKLKQKIEAAKQQGPTAPLPNDDELEN